MKTSGVRSSQLRRNGVGRSSIVPFLERFITRDHTVDLVVDLQVRVCEEDEPMYNDGSQIDVPSDSESSDSASEIHFWILGRDAMRMADTCCQAISVCTIV